MGTYTFRTPATRELPRLLPGSPPDRFWSRIETGKIGSAVLKYADGSYKTIDYPSSQDVATSVEIWWGGYVNIVDEAEAILLYEAGYDIEPTPPIPVTPPPPDNPPPDNPYPGVVDPVTDLVETTV